MAYFNVNKFPLWPKRVSRCRERLKYNCTYKCCEEYQKPLLSVFLFLKLFPFLPFSLSLEFFFFLTDFVSSSLF